MRILTKGPCVLSIVLFVIRIGFTHSSMANAASFDVSGPPLSPAQHNVILVLADDIGVDMLRVYREGGEPLPETPTIDRLASQGVLFRHVWASPGCSPTRVSIQTGRYGFRTGVGDIIMSDSSFTMRVGEVTIPKAIRMVLMHNHASAAIGKWHMGNGLNGSSDGPNLAGYGYYAGRLSNLSSQSYFNWKKTIDGETIHTQTYATTDSVDEAIAWIARQTKPWFLYLAFNASHSPFHVPPHHLVSQVSLDRLRGHDGNLLDEGTLCDDDMQRDCYLAMVEAIDTEMARLLNAINPQVKAQTVIIFTGDNGSPGRFPHTGAGYNRHKGTLYEGGINVPLIISGAGVVQPGRESHALVHATDLYATSIELVTGQSAYDILPPTLRLDSVSLVPILSGRSLAGSLRQYVYTDYFNPDISKPMHGRAIRNGQFKLIRFFQDGREEFYDLAHDPYEISPLPISALTPAQQSNLEALRTQMRGLVGVP